MPSIGKLALQITADATDFIGTLEKVQKRVGSFVGEIASTFASKFKFVTNPFGPIEAGLQSFFDLAGEGSQIKRIRDIGIAAGRVGVDASDFTVWMKATRMEADELSRILLRLQGSINRQGLAAEESAQPLDKWIKNLDQLRAMTPSQQIEEIAKAYQKLPVGVERSSFAIAVAGRKAAEFQKLLQEGPEGLARLKEKMGTQGLLITDADVKRATDAFNATRDLKNSFEGIKTQLALAFAPLITDIANGIQSWIDRMGGAREIAKAIASTILDIAEALLKAVDAIATEIRNLVSDPKLTGGKWAAAISGNPLGYNVINQTQAARPSVLSGGYDYIKKMREGLEGLGKTTTSLIPIMGMWERIQQGVADRQDNLRRSAVQLENSLQDQINAWGLDSKAVEIAKLKREGASVAILENAKALNHELQQLKLIDEDAKAFRDFGKTIEDEVLTPFDKWQQRLEEINEYIARGGNLETGLLAIAKATDTFQESMKSPLAGPAALLQGSSAAVSAVTAAFAGTQDRSNPFKTATEILARQEALQRETRDEIRRLVQLDIPEKDPQGNVIPP